MQAQWWERLIHTRAQPSAFSASWPGPRGENLRSHCLHSWRAVSAKKLGCCLGLYFGPYPRMGPWRLLWQTVRLDKKEQVNDGIPSPSFLSAAALPGPQFPMCYLA